jgi:hypothetical protein
LEALRGSATGPSLIGRANKYTVIKPLEPTASKSAGIHQDVADYSYFVEAKFGSAGKPMYMLVDSGAGTTWVMGSTCKSAACGMHNTFGPDDSKTLKVEEKGFTIQYGTGKVTGHLAHDSVSVAGMEMDMKFGLANETSYDFTHFPFDGILGLSMGIGATDNFMGSLIEKKMLDLRIFSVNLGRASDGINNGQITFGGADPSRHVGEISYTPVSSKANGDWAIPMDDLGHNGKSSGISGRLAYIDTGTSFAFGPESDVAAIHKVIPGAATTDSIYYTVPCSTDTPLTIKFSGVTYTISPKDWISKRDGVCQSNIYGYEVVKSHWLWGDLFLKNVYTVFDGAEKRIGFASKAALPDVPKATVITTAPSVTEGLGGHLPTTGPVTSPGGSESAPPAGQPSDGANNNGSTGSSSSPTQVSPADQLDSSGYVSVLCVVAVLAMVA